MIVETYRFLLAPVQEAKAGRGVSDIQWENFPLNSSAQDLAREIERVLKDNELLITQWAPIHLHNVLKNWFWKDDVKEIAALDVWQKTACYLYLPRLKNDSVYRETLTAGAANKDFFGIAYGKEGCKYMGFSFGKATTPLLDAALLLIEPATAQKYEEAIRAAEEATKKNEVYTPPIPGEPGKAGEGSPKTDTSPQPNAPVKHRFYANIDLDPIQAKKQFADIVDEVVLQFTSKPAVNVKISIEIGAESAAGIDENTQRAVKENCNVLKFKNAEFE